ncbi:large conductance mechanosensitive channel protein MscL [Hujiaoplasma nucleasis]|uniref:Large-conductance mechanosensitive channel n=1 Tax=Hujiaoplasma nucleasis TaxID=2725268 RepID=A0A7L6N5D7_9MOLU|nr:large conductance mechanosensitive channel protein MscL [Hujiaoplasma nucleasis]QLY39789.1 large conductance mechanosensitive channel protein MscL [Hujiaoplasma nucleasis]
MKNFFKDFRAFIAKGNVLDLAVAFIIGAAFNAIVKSLVNDILMPIVSLVFGKDTTNLYWVMKGSSAFNPVTGETVFSENAVVMYYGNFINEVINFFIIALTIFVIIRVFSRIQGRLDGLKQRIYPDKEEVKEE